MAPLVLHNVPDEELYIGADGVTRPFAVVGAAEERRSARLRRQATATHGSFGRARSRARSGSVGPGRVKQQPTKPAGTTTAMAADEMFGNWKREQEALTQHQHQQHHQHQHAPRDGGSGSGGGTGDGSGSDAPGGHADEFLDVRGRGETGRKVSGGSSAGGPADEAAAAAAPETLHKPPAHQPTEVVLRGYRSAEYQYAALRHYEQLAGRICEDYPRDPPLGSRRYRASLRDGAARSAATLASNGRAALTPAERQAVMRAAGGQHWVKVTFESAQAADAALYASPQRILGYLVTAEPYRGVPLAAAEDVAIPDPDALDEYERAAHRHGGGGGGGGYDDQGFGRYSVTSSHTVDSGTVTHDDPFGTRSSTAGSSVAVAGMPGGLVRRSPWDAGDEADEQEQQQPPRLAAQPAQSPAPAAAAGAGASDAFCRRIPTARRATLRAPELALLPSESTMRRVVKRLPLLHRLTGTIIGNQVPRRENGLFDWEKASLYWKLIWWLDYLFQLFGGEILDANKDE